MSNFILVELGPQAKLLYEQLMNKGIIVRYGVIWGLPYHVRISVGTEDDNDKLIQSLREVLDTQVTPST
jgi:histidinol-phosphate aminotransferase